MVSENIKLPVIEPTVAKSQQAPEMVDASIQHEDMGDHKYMEDISEKHIDLEDHYLVKNKNNSRLSSKHHRNKS